MAESTWRNTIATVSGIGIATLLAFIVAVPTAQAATGTDQPPAAPTLNSAFTAASGPTGTTTRLTWSPATDGGAVRGYEVLRVNYFSAEHVIAWVDASQTQYLDPTTAPFANTYSIRAVGNSGSVSPPSNSMTNIVHPRTRPFPAPPGFSCVAEYYYPSIKWPSGQGVTSVNIILTNFGADIDGWTLTWTFPGDVVINGNIRGATITQSGSSAVATSIPSTAVIATNGSVELDFTGDWTTTPAPPTDFLLNGSPCVTG